MTNTHLFFNTSIGKQKPNSIRNKEQVCPFCQREQLTNIIAEDGPIIWLENKYPVLENAHQTVLIETAECDTELSQYDDNHLVRLITFGLDKWLSMEKSDKYKSVIFSRIMGRIQVEALLILICKLLVYMMSCIKIRCRLTIL